MPRLGLGIRHRGLASRTGGALSLTLTLAACGDSGAGTTGATAYATTNAASESGETSTGPSTTSAGPTGSTGADATEGSTTGAPSTTSETTASTTASTTTDAMTTTDGGTTGGSACGGEIVTFEAGKTPEIEIHVASDGADANDCGAEQSPCQTIEHAAGLAGPGAAVVVHAGTYAPDSYISDLQGTVDAPIWIGGAAGEQRPVISGGGQALHLVRARYVIVHDLEAEGASNNGINADDGGEYDNPEAARHIVFRDLFVHDVGQGGNQDCLKLSGLDDYYVLDSEFAACGGGGQGSGVDHVGCHHGVLAGNYFHDMGGNAIQCKGGADDIEVRQNVFDEVGERSINMGGSTGDEFFRPPLSGQTPNFEARDIRVIANSFHGSNATLAFVGCVDCLAANNTIDTPHNWILRILQEKVTTPEYEFLPASGGRFVNNIVYFDRADLSTYVNIGPNTDAPSFSFTNNLWYAYDDPAQSDPGGDLPAAEQAGVYGVDPLLSDPAAGDYSLSAGSPAVGAGMNLDEVTLDLDGVCYLDPPAIGAHELDE